MSRWKVTITIDAVVWVDDPNDEYSENGVEGWAADVIDLYQPGDEAVEVELENVAVEDVVAIALRG